jgi:hypothetical protein
MSIHSTSRAGLSKSKWQKRFQEYSAQGSAAFGSDFSALVYASPVASDTRIPFQEPDPRVFLLPPAAVPSRPTYDVFGDEKVGATHGAVVAASTFSALGVIAGLLSALVGAFALGYQQGLHHKGRR